MRLGFVTAFISHSVMTGFIFGLAIHIAVKPAVVAGSGGHGVDHSGRTDASFS
jgi:Sulfate permease family